MSGNEYPGRAGMNFADWVDQTQTRAGEAQVRQLAEDMFEVSAHRAYVQRSRDRSAVTAWARTPEAQETAARARLIGLFDPVSPEGPRPGPQCPSTAPADPDRYGNTNPVAEALRSPSSAGDEQDGPDAVAPRPGRWRRWCRWISE